MKNKTYQLSKINKSLKKVKDSEIKERLLMIKAYYQQNSFRQAAKQHRCSHMKIKYWKDRYQDKGLRGLYTQPKPGAPRKLKPEQVVEIKREVVKKSTQEGGWQTKQIREYIQQRADVTYSIRHTIRIAQEWGLSKITPRPQYAYAKDQDKQAFLKAKC